MTRWHDIPLHKSMWVMCSILRRQNRKSESAAVAKPLHGSKFKVRCTKYTGTVDCLLCISLRGPSGGLSSHRATTLEAWRQQTWRQQRRWERRHADCRHELKFIISVINPLSIVLVHPRQVIKNLIKIRRKKAKLLFTLRYCETQYFRYPLFDGELWLDLQPNFSL